MRLLVLLWVFLVPMSLVTGEPAPRVPEVSKEERTVNINGEPLTTALFAPAPVYPFHARVQHLEGKGMFEMRLRPDGTVSAVVVLHSTGLAELDRAAAAALIRWRFPAQTTSRIHAIRTPVNFLMKNRFRGNSIHGR